MRFYPFSAPKLLYFYGNLKLSELLNHDNFTDDEFFICSEKAVQYVTKESASEAMYHGKSRSSTPSVTSTPFSAITNVSHPLESMLSTEDTNIEKSDSNPTDLKDKQNTSIDKAADPVDPDRSAVLPLAIGLAVTSAILLMVACRVRVMRKKMYYKRRGPLAMDESDYLINGMYM